MASKKTLNKQSSQQRNNVSARQNLVRSPSNWDIKDYNSFKTVLFYCLLIIIFPVITFFVVKNLICDNLLGLEPVSANISSALCAVIALHVALGIYIYRAYFADEESETVSGTEAVKKQD